MVKCIKYQARVLTCPMSDESDLNLSRSSGHSGLYLDSADEDDCDQRVAPPAEGASVEHYQEYIKYLQLQHGKLEQRNVALNESNNVLNVHQLKRSRKHPLKAPSSNTLSLASQPSSSLSAASPTTLSAPLATSATSASYKASDIDKLILSLAKTYMITTEMFLSDKVNFQSDCPDPPADISSPNRYVKKSTEKDTLVTELYMSIDFVLHRCEQMPSITSLTQFGTRMHQAQLSFINGLHSVAGSIFNMPNEYFMSKYDYLIRWEAGKGKVFNVFKRVFKNWMVLAKVVKVVVCGKMSLFPKARGALPPYAKIWQLTSCTPGLIAFGVTSIIFILSPDQEFSGDGTGAISSILYHSVFRTVKKFFVVKWGRECIKNIVQQINDYIFDGATKTQPDYGASLYDAEPSTKTETHHKSPPISLPPTPAVSQTVHSTPAPIVHNDVAISEPSVSESISSPTPKSLPVTAVPHAAAASVNIQSVEATPEGVLAAADTGTSAKTQKKAVRKRTKAAVGDADVRRSSCNTGTIAK
ncbi:hypothetical protein DFJ58DRAFT_849931 [Suillus subalutaceus]|uniref:uncharacterized protein n=1 Tax=Suillus subalutaceus TaxID=48586 RepID=UPI001B87EE10|nr:uncharacterized protein DFJ58DRAFT_849931 [Suillus subalutaceus]KAG1822152.1 hypothetical protein DFJ58DRAFT_849931 [Suillus subalutaceus]